MLLRVDGGELALEELRITAPQPVSPLLRPLQLAGLALAALIALALVWRRVRRPRRPAPPPAAIPAEDSLADAVFD